MRALGKKIDLTRYYKRNKAVRAARHSPVAEDRLGHREGDALGHRGDTTVILPADQEVQPRQAPLLHTQYGHHGYRCPVWVPRAAAGGGHGQGGAKQTCESLSCRTYETDKVDVMLPPLRWSRAELDLDSKFPPHYSVSYEDSYPGPSHLQ